jgi:hypothetical protein
MEEPRFIALDIHGKKIPSYVSTKAMWDEISDEKSRLSFVEMTNELISSEHRLYNPEFFLPDCDEYDKKILRLAISKNKIMKAQSELSGMSFELYMQSRLLAKWHEHIRGNLTCVDVQKERKETSSISQIVKGLKDRESWKPKPSKEFHSLVEWQRPELSSSWWLAQEYSLAKSYELTFLSTNEIMSKSDAQMKGLILEELAVDNKMNSIVEKQLPLNYLFKCKFCSRIVIVKQGKVPSHCGLAKCRKDYKNTWDNENRPYQPKNARTDSGWEVAFSGKRMVCKGILCDGEELLRQVNLAHICFECYSSGKKP